MLATRPIFLSPMALYGGSIMAVTEALVHVKNALLPLWLWVLLFSYEWSLVVNSQRHGPAEVVIPKRHASRMQPPGWLTYSLYFGGQRHIVHMKVNKLFLSKQLPVFTYTDQEALIEDQPFVQNDCYYHGYVEQDPESQVILSTCLGGFQGILQTNDVIYLIEPKRHSTTFEHFISKMDSEEIQSPPMRCGLTDEEIARQLKFQESVNFTLMQSGVEGWWTHSRVLELAVVVGHDRYLHLQSNTSKVQYEIFLIINELSMYYDQLQVFVALAGIEIWTEKDIILRNDTIENFLQDFGIWKAYSFNDRVPHDAAQVIFKTPFGPAIGHSLTGRICEPHKNCGVGVFLKNDWHSFTNLLAHLIGHNLGMDHDEKYCVCAAKYCIMVPQLRMATKFSNCSIAGFVNTMSKTNCTYIRNNVNYFTFKQCGNSVVEEGEECDCGTLSLCMKDPCCMTNCTLIPGAACAFGLCCRDCQILRSGEVCRIEENECDLPEWCDGRSYHCPEDVYVQNGIPCKGGGHCYEKRCNNRQVQCRNIFGKHSHSANVNCYRQMNTQGDRFGNCGIKNAAYIECNISDILCGRIQCENVTEIPYLIDHSTVHWTRFNGVTCWGTDYHLGMTIPDIGDVKDGTECGTEHICVERKCVHTSLLLRNCSPKTCNMNGVCNNRENCHCHYEWNPPFCLKAGNGGSIDSGPPPWRKLQRKGKEKFNLLLLLLIPFFAALCLLVWWCMQGKKDQKEVNKNPQ